MTKLLIFFSLYVDVSQRQILLNTWKSLGESPKQTSFSTGHLERSSAIFRTSMYVFMCYVFSKSNINQKIEEHFQ